MGAKHIVVLGSCTLDLVFRMPRFPAPGETLFGDGFEMHAGGKGLNQAIAVRRLGLDASIIGRVGEDAFAEPLIAALKADGVDISHLARDPGVGTGAAAPVVVPGGQNSILAAPGANLAVSIEQVQAARETIESAAALLLQFEAPMETNIAAARIAHEASVPVLLNPAPALPHPPELLALADILVLNEVEAAMLAPGAETDLSRARDLLTRGPGVVIVTLGAAGALVATGETSQHVDSFPVAAVDSVGAGDAFCAALAVARAGGQPIESAVRFACAAGAISVTRRGAAPSLPTRAEVEALLAGE